MPYPNKILPPLKLSTAEVILKKIHTFEGKPFTLKQIQRLTRNPKIDLDTVRYHVEKLVDNLWLDRLPRLHVKDQQLYRWVDGLKRIEYEVPDGGPPSLTLRDLMSVAFSLREGNTIEPAQLEYIRNTLKASIQLYSEELLYMEKLYNCPDLWNPKTLVNRLGFREA